MSPYLSFNPPLSRIQTQVRSQASIASLLTRIHRNPSHVSGYFSLSNPISIHNPSHRSGDPRQPKPNQDKKKISRRSAITLLCQSVLRLFQKASVQLECSTCRWREAGWTTGFVNRVRFGPEDSSVNLSRRCQGSGCGKLCDHTSKYRSGAPSLGERKPAFLVSKASRLWISRGKRFQG